MTLKIKVKVTSFRTSPRSLCDKFKTPQKLSCSQGITQTMTEPKTMSPPGRGGGRHNYINLFVRNMYITEATFISQLHSAI